MPNDDPQAMAREMMTRAMDANPDAVLFAGGGTGGHLIPGLAVANELARRGCGHIAFVGTARGLETRLVPEAGYPLHLIEVGGLKNLGWRRRLTTLLRLPLAVLAARRLLKQLRPQVVVGIGGYASGPALAAAAWCRVPIVVLEVNAKTGLANRLAAPFVRAAAVTFPETCADFRRAELTGIPVREEFFTVPESSEHRPPRLFVFGGSLGARAINAATVEAAALWAARGLEINLLHQSGGKEFATVAAAYAAAGFTACGEQMTEQGQAFRSAGVVVRLEPFITAMANALAESDLVVCRSGASTLGELAAAGRAAILIPFPGAADDHQMKNARSRAAAGAARVLPQSELTPATLAAAVEELLADPAARQAMARHARTLAQPAAAQRIATLIATAAR